MSGAATGLRTRVALAALATLALLAGCAADPAPGASDAPVAPSSSASGAAATTEPEQPRKQEPSMPQEVATPEQPASPEPTSPEADATTADPDAVADPGPTLAGRVVVVDPGHQLGNSRFPAEVNATVDAGMGVRKACNTTGTATDSGVPESTVNWQVAQGVVAGLQERGAEVILTRSSDSVQEWGPCIDERGSIGNDRADLLLSIHADGMPADAHGFHVLVPGPDQGTYPESTRFAQALRTSLEEAGFARATYITDAIRASNDYGTLNRSTKPAAIVEMGNMRHDGDAAALVDPESQARYAQAMVAAVERHLTQAP